MSQSSLKGRPAQVVACLTAHGPSDVTTIANRTKIPRSSVNRVCLKLAESGELLRSETSPILYRVGDVAPPKWIAIPEDEDTEPMCKALFEACKRALKDAPDRRIILDDPHFVAAQELWEPRAQR